MFSGHGKAILFGEHAVVYGQPALALALPDGVRASAARAAEPCLRIPAWRVELGSGTHPPEQEALARWFETLRRLMDEPCLVLEVEPQLPAGGGLGSSAALAVAALRAVAGLQQRPLANEQLEEHALELERIFHGDPSGIDTAAAARGGLIRFRRSGGQRVVERLAPRAALRFVLAYTGSSGNTGELVAGVRRLREARPRSVGRILNQIGRVADDGARALTAGRLEELGALFDENHGLLQALRVSTPQLDALVHAARAAGALGAKLTGAGGGGSLIALSAGEPDKLALALRQAGAAFTRCVRIEAEPWPRLRGVFLDVDGVLVRHHLALPGAAEALRAIRARGLKLMLLTNLTRFSSQALAEVLGAAGIEVAPEEVLTAQEATLAAIRAAQPGAKVHLLAPPHADADFAAAGLQPSREGSADCVYIGYDRQAGFAELSAAFQAVDAGAPLFAAHMDKSYPDTSGQRSLGLGGLVAAVSFCSDQEPILCGKPQAKFFQQGLERLGLPADEVAFVGDSLFSDLIGSSNAGLRACALVLTGTYRRGDAFPDGVAPDAVLPSIAEVPAWLDGLAGES